MSPLLRKVLKSSLNQIDRMTAEELLSWIETSEGLFRNPGEAGKIAREHAYRRLDLLTR